MKKIIVNISNITDNICGITYYTHYVNFPTNPNWSYSIIASIEGFMYNEEIWKQAGYEVEWKNKYSNIL